MYSSCDSSIPLDSSAILEAQQGMFAVVGTFFALFFGIILIVLVVQTIAMWKIFNKAGEKGWKSIIPIYNAVILFKISGISPLLVLVYLASPIPYVGPIIVLVLTIYQSVKLSKSFGKSDGFTVGLVLVAPIFYMILGFGKSQYVGTWYSNNNSTITE